MTSTLLLAAMALGRQEAAGVPLLSLTLQAAPVARQLDVLSEKTGRQLRATPGVAGEVIAARFENAKTQEALDRIAGALGAEWEKSGDTLWLKRRSQADNEDRLAAAQWAEARLKKDLADLAQRSQTDSPFDVAAATRTATSLMESIEGGRGGGGRGGFQQGLLAGAQSPSGRLAARAVKGLSASQLAGLPVGSRTVFSSRPNRMQRPLGFDAGAAVRDFVREQGLFAQAFQQELEKRARGGDQIRLSTAETSNVEGNPAKLTVAVSRPSFETWSVQVQLLGDRGEILASQMSFLGGGAQTLMAPGMVIAPTASTQEPRQQPSEKPIELSAEAKQAAEWIRSAGPGGRGGGVMMFDSGQGRPMRMEFDPSGGPAPAPARPDSTSVARLADPVAREPLDWVADEWFLGVAQVREKNLVAWLPDSLLVRTALMTSMAPEQILQLAKSTWGLEVTDAEGWMTVRPIDRLGARRERADRQALKNLIDQAVAERRVSLRSAFTYARSVPTVGSTGIAVPWLSLVAPAQGGHLAELLSPENRPWLKVAGLMPPAQWEMLQKGGQIPFSSLTLDQREILGQAVFHNLMAPRPIRTDGQDNRGGRGRGRGPMREIERTELLPDGIPAAASLSLRIDREPGVLATDNAGQARFMSANDLGVHLARQDSGVTEMLRTRTTYSRFVPVTSAEYEFRLSMGVAEIEGDLDDVEIDLRANAVAYDALPEALRAAVTASQQRAAETLRNVRVGGRGRPNPEP